MAVSATVVQDAGGPATLPLIFSRVWMVTATLDPASVATQVTGTDTVTVSGVLLGDSVIFKSLAVTGSDANMTITAYVSAANTVTLLHSNNTAGAIDLLTGTLKMVIVRPAF